MPGYGCEDHFLEQDTIEHSWECIVVCEGSYPFPLCIMLQYSTVMKQTAKQGFAMLPPHTDADADAEAAPVGRLFPRPRRMIPFLMVL